MDETRITCSNCDYVGFNSVAWGYFQYQVERRAFVSLHRSLGWCRQCLGIAAVEDLSPEPVDSTIAEEEAKVAKKEGEYAKYQNNIWCWLFEGQRRRELARELRGCKERLLEGMRYKELLNSRTSQARCLECSGTDVVTLEMPRPPRDGIPLVTSSIHPGCGGCFIVRGGRRIYATFLKIKVYSPEGVFLKSKRSRERW